MTDDHVTMTLGAAEATLMVEDIEAQLSRIATALERIADRLDYLGEGGVLSTEIGG